LSIPTIKANTEWRPIENLAIGGIITFSEEKISASGHMPMF
jgi:hypothetical protein